MNCEVEDTEKYADRQLRCPRLGGEVLFGYCEREAEDLPCSRIINCWHAYLPVEEYLRQKLSDEKWTRFMSTAPKDKVAALLELIERAKKRNL